MSETRDGSGHDPATDLVLSYRLVEDGDGAWGTPNSNWTEKQLTTTSFKKQLLRSHGGEVTVGEEWSELLPCGCEKPQDVVLGVEAVRGGDSFVESTELTVQPA